MANEFLDEANEIANAEITRQRIRCEAKLMNSFQQRNMSRLPNLAGVANEWIDMENSGSFDCTHYTFDKCGDLQVPRVRRK